MHALPPRAALVPNAIAFRDPSSGLLGTGLLRGSGSGTISLTTDGGRTWKVAFRTPRPVVWVAWNQSALSARYDDGENVQSVDGGRTWTPFFVGNPQFNVGCPLGTQQMPNNSLTGNWSLCTNQPGAGNQGKAVYEFKTHGWTRLACTSFPNGNCSHGGISSYGYPQGIAIANDGFGIIWESRGTLYVTRDAGSNWVGLPKVARPEIDFGVSAYALSKGLGFALLAYGGTDKRRLIETTDAGRHWRTVHSWN